MKDIMKLNNKVVTEDEFEELEENPNVVNIDCVGNSGNFIGKNWYDVQLVTGEHIDIYF